MTSTAAGEDEDSDDPFDRPPKVLYGANTIEISCNLDEEEEKERIDAQTAYERQYAPFNNPNLAKILGGELSRGLPQNVKLIK